MARTESNMIELGTRAPAFTLPDSTSGRMVSLEEARGKRATVLFFICNHCPFVKHVNPELVKLAEDYKGKEVGFIAINSNDVESHPADSPEQMRVVADRWRYPFPYLYDETQAVAKRYEAACTPDFYVFDPDLQLVYRGQLDDSRPENGKPLTGKDIRAALDAILANQPVSADQKPSIGCNIKWKQNR